MSSSLCKGLNSPYITALVRSSNSLGTVTSHSFEMTLSEFKVRMLKHFVNILQLYYMLPTSSQLYIFGVIFRNLIIIIQQARRVRRYTPPIVSTSVYLDPVASCIAHPHPILDDSPNYWSSHLIVMYKDFFLYFQKFANQMRDISSVMETM